MTPNPCYSPESKNPRVPTLSRLGYNISSSSLSDNPRGKKIRDGGMFPLDGQGSNRVDYGRRAVSQPSVAP